MKKEISKKRSSFSGIVSVVAVTAVLSIFSAAQANVYVEIESVPAVGKWKLETVKPGYYGIGYFFWTGGDVIGQNKDPLVYKVTIPTAGKYAFAIRGRRDKEGACASGKHDICNDVAVDVGDGSGYHKKLIKLTPEDVIAKAWGGRWNEWMWDPLFSESEPNMDFPAGERTIKIAGRSAEVKLDAMRIWLVGTTPPDGPITGIADMNQRKLPVYHTGSIKSAAIYAYNGRKIKTVDNTSLAKIRDQLHAGLYIISFQADGKKVQQKLLVN